MNFEPVKRTGRRLPDVPHFLPIQPRLIVPTHADSNRIQFRFPEPFGQQIPRDLWQVTDCALDGRKVGAPGEIDSDRLRAIFTPAGRLRRLKR